MPKVSGPLTLSKVSKRLLQFTPPVGVAKLSCQTREKCMVSHIFNLLSFRDCRVEEEKMSYRGIYFIYFCLRFLESISQQTRIISQLCH